jgi:large subunit ribosomal protein L15e
MGYLKYVKEAWKQPRKTNRENYKARIIEWRRENTVTRSENPTRPDRARALGYKAKQGFVIARVKNIRGGKKNPRISSGRNGGNLTKRLDNAKNYRWICEEKAQKRFVNMEVLNSYWVGDDEKYIWYEVILVDPMHPQIIADKDRSWVVSNKQKKRSFKGITSAGKKSRGLHKKGMGAEKARPSIRANKNKLR